jgi:hypothetical protein
MPDHVESATSLADLSFHDVAMAQLIRETRTEPKSFLFDHIPKTAGTSLRAVFSDLLGADQVSPPVTGRSELWAIRRLQRYQMIIGHFVPVPLDVRVRERIMLTVLRHPVDRALSGYFYLRHHVDEAVGGMAARLARQYDIPDCLAAMKDHGERYLSNFMTNHFSLKHSRAVGDQKDILNAAKQVLRSYDCVGLYEELNGFVAHFCRTYGFAAPGTLPELNRTEGRVSGDAVSRRDIDSLREANELDLLLYEDAVALWREQSSAKRSYAGPCPSSATPSPDAPQRKAESFGDRDVEIVAVGITGERSLSQNVASGENIAIRIGVFAHVDVSDLTVGIEITDDQGEVAFGTNSHHLGARRNMAAGTRCGVVFLIRANLNLGRYHVTVALHTGADHRARCFHWVDRAGDFAVTAYDDAAFIGYAQLQPAVTWGAPD